MSKRQKRPKFKDQSFISADKTLTQESLDTLGK